MLRPTVRTCISGALLLSLLPTLAQAQQPIWILPAKAKVQAEKPPVPPGQSVAPAHQGLTLEELEQIAMGSNPSIARASALVSAARGKWLQAGLPPNPEFGYEGQQLGSRGLAEQEGVIINQEIVRGGKLRLSRAVVAQEINLAQQQLATQQQRVLTDVRVSFYQVLVAQRQIDLTMDLVSIGKKGSEVADALFRAKDVSRIDVLQAQIEVENAEILAQNARNRHQAAWQTLASVVGDLKLPPQALAGDAFAPPRHFDFNGTLERLQTTSPEMGMAMAQVSRTRAAVERARAEPRPNLSVQGLVNWRDNGIGGLSDGSLALSAPLPLWNRNQGAIAEAQYEYAAAKQALSQLELSFQHRLAPIFERYANARNQVERYRDRILPSAQESLQLTRQIYEKGESNFIALLTVQRTYFQTNMNYLEALRELRTAEAELEGLLLSGSLEAR